MVASPDLEAQRDAGGVQALRVGVLVDAHAGFLAGAGQFERELGRMHDRTGVGVVQASQVGRRMNLVADSSRRPSNCPSPCVGGVGEPVDLMWFGRHRQHAGALPFGVEPERLDVGLHAVEVLPAHRLERVNLVGPARLSVLQAVCQAGVDEAAVAPRRGPADPVGLDEHDAAIRISLGGMQCGPQPRVTPADHQQVADDRSGSLRVLGPRDVEPHRAEGACRKGTFDQAGIDVGIEYRLHIADTTGFSRLAA